MPNDNTQLPKACARDHPVPKEERPRGILFLLEPEYADLIPAEDKFARLMKDAALAGRLWIPVEYILDKPTVH